MITKMAVIPESGGSHFVFFMQNSIYEVLEKTSISMDFYLRIV